MKVINAVVFICLLATTSCKEPKTNNEAATVIAHGKMPSLAKDASANIHIVFGSNDSIMYANSNNGGKTFSSPLLIDTLHDLVASATRGPQIAVTKNGIAVIAVNKAGNIYGFIRQENNEWVRTSMMNDIPEVDKEGFSGLSSCDNNLFAIWTDLREDNHNKIFGAKSTDGGKTWAKNILVYKSPDSTVCECCKPSVAMQGNNVYVMFRNWLNGNRDLYLIQSSDGGTTFGKAEKLGNGSWKLDGCPMDGGGLAINAQSTVQTVWRRESKIYADEPGKPEREIGEGKGCTIETANGKSVYAWTNNNGEIVCLLPNGTNKIIGKGSLPLLKFVSNNEVVCVWQDDDVIKSAIVNMG